MTDRHSNLKYLYEGDVFMNTVWITLNPLPPTVCLFCCQFHFHIHTVIIIDVTHFILQTQYIQVATVVMGHWLIPKLETMWLKVLWNPLAGSNFNGGWARGRARARAKVQQQGCAAAGHSGCCTGDNCRTASGCNCGVDCYLLRNCCDDITVVGCYRE